MAIPSVNMARAYVDLPAPQHKIGGLFSVASVIDVTDPHILLGAQAQTDACEPAGEWEHKCPIEYPGSCGVADSATRQKKATHGFSLVTGDPFTVYDSIDCKDKADYSAEVRAGLALKEQKAVEKHVAELLSTFPKKADAASIAAGIGEAEAWLAENYEGLGIIHLSPYLAVMAAAAEVVAPGLDGSMATVLGTPVAVGAGYSSTATRKDIYASGQMLLYRGPVHEHTVPGMQNGTVCAPPRALAERTYVPLIECGAAKFTITAP